MALRFQAASCIMDAKVHRCSKGRHKHARRATTLPPCPACTWLDAPFACRAKLEPIATVDGGLELQQVHSAADGTRKLVFRLTVRHALNSGFQLLYGRSCLGCKAAASPVGPL